MKRWVKITAATAAVLLLGALVGRALMARKAEQAKAAMPIAASVIELAPGDVVVAVQAELVRTLAISGGLKAVNSAVVKAKVAAEVKDIAVREGDTVQAGQLLARLDPTEFAWKLRQAEDQANAAKAQLDSAQRTLENNRALVAQGFISATGLETSVSNDAAAQASFLATQAAVDLARKSVADAVLVAPISGLVSQRLVQPGEKVSPDAKLLEIVDLSHLELEASIAPEDIASLTVGSPATLKVDGLAAPLMARVARINPTAQTGSRSVTAYLAVDAHPALRQGLFAKGSIETARRRVLAVPVTAVRTEQSLPYVLQVLGGKAVQTPVRLGLRGEVAGQPWVEIASGLADGAQVLGASVGTVRDGTPVRLAGAVAVVPSAGAATLASER